MYVPIWGRNLLLSQTLSLCYEYIFPQMSPKRSSPKSQETEATFIRLCLLMLYPDTAGRLAECQGAQIQCKFDWTWVQIMNLLLTQELSFLINRKIKFQVTQGYNSKILSQVKRGRRGREGKEMEKTNQFWWYTHVVSVLESWGKRIVSSRPTLAI